MSKNIENCRAFFKKAAQAALAVPFLAVAAKENETFAAQEISPSASCNSSCLGGCYGTCGGRCTGTCRGGCEGCSGNCSGSCSSSCSGSCDHSGSLRPRA